MTTGREVVSMSVFMEQRGGTRSAVDGAVRSGLPWEDQGIRI